MYEHSLAKGWLCGRGEERTESPGELRWENQPQRLTGEPRTWHAIALNVFFNVKNMRDPLPSKKLLNSSILGSESSFFLQLAHLKSQRTLQAAGSVRLFELTLSKAGPGVPDWNLKPSGVPCGTGLGCRRERRAALCM